MLHQVVLLNEYIYLNYLNSKGKRNVINWSIKELLLDRKVVNGKILKYFIYPKPHLSGQVIWQCAKLCP